MGVEMVEMKWLLKRTKPPVKEALFIVSRQGLAETFLDSRLRALLSGETRSGKKRGLRGIESTLSMLPSAVHLRLQGRSLKQS